MEVDDNEGLIKLDISTTIHHCNLVIRSHQMQSDRAVSAHFWNILATYSHVNQWTAAAASKVAPNHPDCHARQYQQAGLGDIISAKQMNCMWPEILIPNHLPAHYSHNRRVGGEDKAEEVHIECVRICRVQVSKSLEHAAAEYDRILISVPLPGSTNF